MQSAVLTQVQSPGVSVMTASVSSGRPASDIHLTWSECVWRGRAKSSMRKPISPPPLSLPVVKALSHDGVSYMRRLLILVLYVLQVDKLDVIIIDIFLLDEDFLVLTLVFHLGAQPLHVLVAMYDGLLLRYLLQLIALAV